MIKVESLGMLFNSKNNPVLTHTADVRNNSFVTIDDILYFVANEIHGDDSYKKDLTIAKGEFLNGFQVDAWVGQKLVVDASDVADGITSLSKGDVLVVDTATGLLKVGSAPSDGIYFKVSDLSAELTEKAIKVRICEA